MKEILILGEFSSGKTAFINMLLSYPVLSEKMTSTDLPTVKLEHSDSNSISYTNNNQIISINSWSELPYDWEKVKLVNVAIKDHPILSKNTIIYDTPGINTTNTHHLEHIDNFLNTNPKNYELVLFFIPDKISKTAIDFLNKWKSKFRNIMLVINIKDEKSDSECRQIEKNVKRTVMSELGSLPVHLLSIGVVYEHFYEKYENASDWKLQNDWEEKQDSFNKLIAENIDSIIGEDIFEIISSIVEKEVRIIEDYTKLSDDELEDLIKYDDSKAMFEKASRYLDKNMFDEAVPVLREAVKFENSDAQNALGVCYEEGLGVTKNLDASLEFYTKSANLKNNKGLLNLGLYYLNNLIENNWDKAFELLKDSAKLGNHLAEFEVGKLYLDNRKLDEDKAFELISKSVKNKISEAFSQLALLYETGIGVDQDLEKAANLFEQSIQHEDPIAYYKLYLYHNDTSINYKNNSLTFTYIKKAAEAGILEAQYYYALELEERNNNEEAFNWYTKSYENGYLYAGLTIANYHLEGHGVEVDKERAFLILHKLAKEGFSEAKNPLAICYANGEGVVRDTKKALDLFNEAAKEDVLDAQLNLADFYEKGELGMIVNLPNACYWHYKASFLSNREKLNSFLDKHSEKIYIQIILSRIHNHLGAKLKSNSSTKITTFFEKELSQLSELERNIININTESLLDEINQDYEFLKNYECKKYEILNKNNPLEVEYQYISNEILSHKVNQLKKLWDEKIPELMISYSIDAFIKKGEELSNKYIQIENEFNEEMTKAAKPHFFPNKKKSLRNSISKLIHAPDNINIHWEKIAANSNSFRNFSVVTFNTFTNVVDSMPQHQMFSDQSTKITRDIKMYFANSFNKIQEDILFNWSFKSYQTPYFFDSGYAEINMMALVITTITLLLFLFNSSFQTIGTALTITVVLFVSIMSMVLGIKRTKKLTENLRQTIQKDATAKLLLSKNTFDLLIEEFKSNTTLIKDKG